MSAMPSGPRAMTGAEASMLAAQSEIAIPVRRRRLVKAGLAPVMFISKRVEIRSTVRPNGSVAQAFAPDNPAKNRPVAAHDYVYATTICAS